VSKVSVADVLELSVAERIQLVEEIWDSIAAVPQAVPLTPAQRAELGRRLEDYRLHPEEGSPWDDVRSRILTSKE
jgi:putative addiction module component (TIGR02574 family)